jgi:hypothetical protein
VERLIRLPQNAEVVGTDEAFFEDELTETATVAFEDLYNEKAGILDGEVEATSGARRKPYARLKEYIDKTQSTLFPVPPELHSGLEDLYKYPAPGDRQLRSRISDEQLASLVIDLRADNRLCQVPEHLEAQEPQIICSLGLFESADLYF